MNQIDSQRRQWLAHMGRLAAGGAGLAVGLSTPGLVRAASSVRPGADIGCLVVVMLRGALDGLAAVPAIGDPAWQALRPTSATDEARYGAPLALAGTPFALHGKLRSLHDWYRDGQLLVVHAVASPYRERSHFDAQQLVESGSNRPFEFNTGWLGRGMADRNARGIALGAALPLAMRGAPGASSWAPSHEAAVDTDLMSRVARMYEADPQLRPVFAQARGQQQGGMADGSMIESDRASAAGSGFVALARQAGRFLAAADGPPVAWLEASGWDTHTQQAARLSRQLEVLDQGLAALRESLGERWASTTVLVMTEFGRTAAMNGNAGTDHGTAGVAFVAGGRVAGGRVLADWPGLARSQLFENRDLRPTTDLRALMKPALQRHLGLSTAQIDRDVLPGAPRGSVDLWRA